MPDVRQLSYYEALDDISTAALQYGINESIKLCHYFPKPADIREHAMMYREPQRLSIENQLPEITDEQAAKNLRELNNFLSFTEEKLKEWRNSCVK
jgi:hypothetical protein